MICAKLDKNENLVTRSTTGYTERTHPHGARRLAQKDSEKLCPRKSPKTYFWQDEVLARVECQLLGGDEPMRPTQWPVLQVCSIVYVVYSIAMHACMHKHA